MKERWRQASRQEGKSARLSNRVSRGGGASAVNCGTNASVPRVPRRMAANAMVRPCSCPSSEACWDGAPSKGAPPCPTNQTRPLRRWASISARIRSTSLALINAAQLCCAELRGRHGRTYFDIGRQGAQPPRMLLIDATAVAIKGKRRARSTSVPDATVAGRGICNGRVGSRRGSGFE
jgi:hypothetical protein